MDIDIKTFDIETEDRPRVVPGILYILLGMGMVLFVVVVVVVVFLSVCGYQFYKSYWFR